MLKNFNRSKSGIVVARLAEHTLIERQPGQLPVSVVLVSGKFFLVHALLYLPFLPDNGPYTENGFKEIRLVGEKSLFQGDIFYCVHDHQKLPLL